MERSKVVIIVVMALVLCTGTGWAAAYALGGDWNTSSSWYGGYMPTASDAVYTPYAATPQTVAAGETGEALYLYLSMYTGYTAGSAVVEGTLNTGGLLYGNWGAASTPTTDSLLQVGDLGVANLTYIKATGLGQTNTQYIVVDGGVLDFAGAFEGGETIDATGAFIDITVNLDGYLGISGTVTGDASNLSIDITSVDATLVMLQAEYDALQAAGVILAEGVVDAGAFQMTDLGGGLGAYTIPEPATMVLLGLGALVLRRKK